MSLDELTGAKKGLLLTEELSTNLASVRTLQNRNPKASVLSWIDLHTLLF